MGLVGVLPPLPLPTPLDMNKYFSHHYFETPYLLSAYMRRGPGRCCQCTLTYIIVYIIYHNFQTQDVFKLFFDFHIPGIYIQKIISALFLKLTINLSYAWSNESISISIYLSICRHTYFDVHTLHASSSLLAELEIQCTPLVVFFL